jgi:hypothetical protein
MIIVSAKPLPLVLSEVSPAFGMARCTLQRTAASLWELFGAKVHFQAADIATIKSFSLRGIEARTGRLALRYLTANGILHAHGRNDDHRRVRRFACFLPNRKSRVIE